MFHLMIVVALGVGLVLSTLIAAMGVGLLAAKIFMKIKAALRG